MGSFLERWFILDATLIWSAAIVGSYSLSMWYTRKECLAPGIIAKAGIWSMMGAYWGGHLFSLMIVPQKIIEDPIRILRFSGEGKGLFGAIFGAWLFGGLYLRWKKAPILSYADTVTPAVILGYICARIGCYLNGCCFGTPSNLPWSVQFPEQTLAFFDHWSQGWLHPEDTLSLAVHPTQVYHAAIGILLFWALRKWEPGWPGSRFAFGLGAYGSLRFLIQFLRGDRIPLLGFMDINQIFSLISVMIAGLLWWRFGRKQTTSILTTPALPSADPLQP